MKWIDWISRLPRQAIIIICFTCILVEGGIDHFSGPLVNFDFIYILPIGVLAWFAGLKSGVAGIGLVLLINLLNRLAWMPAYPINAVIWNTISDLLDFSLTAFLLTTLKKQIDQLKELAAEDYLTKLPNRRSFYHEVRREANHCQRNGSCFSIAYIDVDNFKIVNDTLGHSAGDELLVNFTKILRQNTRTSDVIARLGGDEFAILFPGVNVQQSQSAVQKILDRLNDAEADDKICQCSIGVITLSSPLDNLDEMITIADQMMYIAKSNGKNTACYAEFSPPDNLHILN